MSAVWIVKNRVAYVERSLCKRRKRTRIGEVDTDLGKFTPGLGVNQTAGMNVNESDQADEAEKEQLLLRAYGPGTAYSVRFGPLSPLLYNPVFVRSRGFS